MLGGKCARSEIVVEIVGEEVRERNGRIDSPTSAIPGTE